MDQRLIALYQRFTAGGEPHWRIVRAVVRWSAVLYRQLLRDKAFVRAASMAYTTLVAIVPMLVLIFGVLRGTRWLGFGDTRIEQVQDLIFGTFLGDIPQVRDFIVPGVLGLDFGALGIVGVLSLLVVAARLYLIVENSYNEIFGVPVRRSFGMRLLNFYFTLTIVPVAMVLAVGGAAEVRGQVPFPTEVVGAALQFVVLLVALRVFPCTVVRWRAALAGAGVSWVLLLLAGQLLPLYLRFVASEDPLRVIYGSLGLLPVFLLWLFMLWVIVLLGVEIAYVTQNFSSLIQAELEQWEESHHVLRAPSIETALEVVAFVAWSFEQGHGPVGLERIARVTQVTARDLAGVLRVLEQAGILIRAEGQTWTPTRPARSILIREVIDEWRKVTSVRRVGESPVGIEVSAALKTHLSGSLADVLDHWIDDQTLQRAEQDLFTTEMPMDRDVTRSTEKT